MTLTKVININIILAIVIIMLYEERSSLPVIATIVGTIQGVVFSSF
jgi:hypothetical protein